MALLLWNHATKPCKQTLCRSTTDVGLVLPPERRTRGDACASLTDQSPHTSPRCHVPRGGVLLVHHKACLEPRERSQHRAENCAGERADKGHEAAPPSVGARQDSDHLQHYAEGEAQLGPARGHTGSVNTALVPPVATIPTHPSEKKPPRHGKNVMTMKNTMYAQPAFQ